jgi:hypothetical protein
LEGKTKHDWDDYLRQQAAMYRQLAEKTEDAFIKQELVESSVLERHQSQIENMVSAYAA